MVSFNFSMKQMTVKVVYYGPGLCGKTTNLQYIYDHTTGASRGEMVSLETEADRTLFFDLLPLEVGTIAGLRTRIQLYTVPGQVFYNTTRKLVLKGVDGVVFVADSQRTMTSANRESQLNLESNLSDLDISLDTLPLVYQYNKRDLDGVSSVEELDDVLSVNGSPRIEASALTGLGVFETLRAISKRTLVSLKSQLENGEKLPSELEDAPPSKPRSVGPQRERRSARRTVAAASPARPPSPDPPTTPESKPAPAAPKKAPPRQGVLLKLDQSTFERASRVSLKLKVEDDEHQLVREFKEVDMDLDRSSDAQGMKFVVEIRPNTKS
jgi:signal recognition particle receptor subunit beta